MTINIGLIGAGRMGQVHAENLVHRVPGARLTVVADADAARAAAVAVPLGAAAVGDYRRMLDDPQVDAVVIVTPTGTHAAVIADAAQARKSIFCEKPLAMTLAECDQAIAAAQQAGVILQVGLMRRFDPAYLAAKQHIDAGTIGQPVMIKSLGRDPKRTSLDFARRENSGGMIADMGVHDFDSARWLMGSEVERVYSEGGCLVYPELADVGDIDNAVVNLKFANGAIGNIDLSRNAVYGYDIRTEVIGSRGSLMIGRLQHTPLLVLTANHIAHDGVPYFMERYGEAYVAEMRSFVACVSSGSAPAVSALDARAATAIAVAATRSLDEARPVAIREAADPGREGA
ncbi:MAG: inositol 2-dehydrogenase [Chloroflexi bacterium]|nr:inositol 2-dehydrogenase [Chloroflexota bacterium]